MSEFLVRGTPYVFDVPGLLSIAGNGYQIDPTIVKADVQISKDGGPYVEITNAPSVLEGESLVTVSLTAEETDCQRFLVRLRDVSGDQWHEVYERLATIPNALATAAELAKVIKVGESVTIVRTGRASITYQHNRP